MKRIEFLYGFILILALQESLHAQSFEDEKPSKISFNGYLKDLHSVSFENLDGEWLQDNFIHNRLNFKWYASDALTFTVENRNRLFYGETVKTIPNYDELIDADEGFFDLSTIVFSDSSYFLHSTLDRAYVDWSKGNWQVRLGRQRINWGQAFVWNPNDIFNTYSFFDFDYEERPGSDALLVRYYTGAVSSVEFVFSPAREFGESSYASMYKTNAGGYDFQLLAGKMKDDVVLGGGWAGQIKSAGFKGELSYFIPEDQPFEGMGTLVASTSIDYTFANSLFLHGEMLYNSNGASGKPGMIDFNQNLTPKTLSATKFSFFGEAQYEITPLIKAGLSGIASPNDGSYFLGPTVDFSLTENLYFLLVAQVFGGSEDSSYGSGGTFVFTRLKWNF
ncbi:hypothetical protein R9C00_03490 [Flammeovirgaceae bacterium SG7u.111]|nr:hypothetical protein [Flammeovirgaceae bacterium SG7u.132]WPO36507.1 hypothetical protein R9C00_03490 [Flammeovirgaceae bacterium SG7u.111]